MDQFDVIRLGTVILAFVGYFACLARYGLITLVLTALFGVYLSRFYPLTGIYQPYWIGAVLFVLILALGARLGKSRPPAQDRTAPQDPQPDSQEIVIDGTNVLYWDGEQAELSTLCIVVDDLRRRGYAPFVFLDASSRHHLNDTSLTEKSFAKALACRRPACGFARPKPRQMPLSSSSPESRPCPWYRTTALVIATNKLAVSNW